LNFFKPCGVDYELKAYVAEDLEEKPHKRNSVRLAIRKLTYAPPSRAPQPTAEAHREFIMSPAPLHLECTLDKEVIIQLIFIFKFFFHSFQYLFFSS
jgi:beta-arrestin